MEKQKKPEELSKTQPNQEENTSLQKNNQTLQRQINTFLNKNPQFIPFKFPDLKQFFQKSGAGNNPSSSNSSTSQGGQTSTATDTIEETLSKYKAVKALYDQTLENLVNFWSMVWLIIKDQNRFNYIRNNLCKGEVAEEVKEPKDIFYHYISNSGFEYTYYEVVSRVTGISLLGPSSLTCGISPLFIVLKDYGKKFALNSNISGIWNQKGQLVGPKRLRISFDKSICYNLTAFARNGLYMVVNKATKLPALAKCIGGAGWGLFYCRDVNVVEPSCKNIGEEAIKAAEVEVEQYFKVGEEIYKKQIIPLFRDLCFKKCMCSDLGIKCGIEVKREFGVKETIATLVYESLFKKVLESASVISKIPNLSSRGSSYESITYNLLIENNCASVKDSVKDSLEKIKENMSKLMDKVFERSGASQQIINSVMNDIKNANFFSALTTLQNKLPELFIEVITSSEFNELINWLGNFINNLKNQARKTRYMLCYTFRIFRSCSK
jgi:hypothetical protein